MSLEPWPIALDPSISTSPAFMNALSRVRRVIRPPPYELVRHSVFARAPDAPLGQRLALPDADTGIAVAAATMTAKASATSTRRFLNGIRAHEQSLRVGEGQRVPHARACDERQRCVRACRKQRRNARAGADTLQDCDPE